jgi:DNA-binding protein HU-beta
MNKSELIESIAKSTQLTKVDVAKTLDAFIETCKKELKKGGEINLVGFMSLKKVKRKARTGKNPSNGEVIKIPAKNTVKIKAGKALQDSVNN